MVGRWKQKSWLVLAVALCAIVGTSAASAQPSERATLDSAEAGNTLVIYGMGGRDDVAQGRLDMANRVIQNAGHSVSNPVGGFNDQAFLARLAARDVPDLVYMGRDKVGTYAARNALIPLANCIAAV